MSQLIVVITGGIASGKTQVSQYFAGLGCVIIDADEVARNIVLKNTPGWQALYKRFGSEVLQEDGEINRRFLRKKVFNDSKALADLNAITHPLITASIKTSIKQAANKLIFVVIPLLTQTSRHHYFNRVLVVDVCEKIQHQRLQARDQIDVKLSEKMLASQINRKQRLQLADDVITNYGSLQDLRISVGLMHGFYLSLVA